MPRTTSAIKKEKKLVKALAKDMKGKKIDPRTGKVVTKRPAPKPKAPPKATPKPRNERPVGMGTKPRNKRSGKDYVGRGIDLSNGTAV